MKKVIIIIVIVVCLATAVFFLQSASSGRAEQINPKLIVDVVRQDLRVTVRETGRVEPLVSIEIKSKIPGQVARLAVDEGDRVAAGQVLLELDTTSYRYRSEQARAAYDEAVVREEYATLNLERREREFAAKSLAAHDRDAARLEKKLAEYGVQKSRIEWESTRDDLQHCQLRSPIAGIVIHRGVEIGEMVSPGVDATVEGKPLLTVADLSRLIVTSNLNQIDMARVEREQSVEIRFDALPDRLFQGRVHKIAPSARQITGNLNLFPVEILLEEATQTELIKPGMTADIDILVAAKEQILTVPIEAVRQADGGKTVVVVTGTPAHYQREDRSIQTGLHNDRFIEIVSGLGEGDRVLIDPASASPNELSL